MISWGKKNRPARVWPLLAMLALGLVAGTGLGGYLASQRSQMKRLAQYAHRIGDELTAMDKPAAKPLAVVATPRSNHRRKAASEV
jgi:hypothetical protein